jgi:hypothetical protein
MLRAAVGFFFLLWAAPVETLTIGSTNNGNAKNGDANKGNKKNQRSFLCR